MNGIGSGVILALNCGYRVPSARESMRILAVSEEPVPPFISQEHRENGGQNRSVGCGEVTPSDE